MLLRLYGLYRSCSLDSTLTFALLSAMLFLLYRPKKRFARLRLWQYLLLSASSFTLFFQGVLLLSLHGEGLIFSQPAHYFYYFLCHVVLALLWSHLFLRGQFFSRLLCTLFFVATMQLYRGACVPFFLLEGEIAAERYAIWDVALACGLYLILAGLTLLFRKMQIQELLPPERPLRFAMLAILLSLLGVAMLPGYFPEISYSWGIALLLVDMSLVYFVFSSLIRNNEAQRHYDAALAREESNRAVFQETLRLRDEIHRERHELKNRYFRLNLLLRQKELDALKEELENIIGTLDMELSSIETGSTHLDYLLTAKKKLAEAAGIPFHIQSQCPAELKLNELVAGTVLSNLLDNAIEASRKEEKPEITVTLRCLRGYFNGKVTNRVSQDVLQINPMLITTKEDTRAHGYGVSIVRRALKECNGFLRFSVEEGRFTAAFLLPIEEDASPSAAE